MPCLCTGSSIPTFSRAVGPSSSSTPSRSGIECPYTSASSSPTLSPCAAKATARLTVTDDLPTPPLPEAMAITRVWLVGLANGMSRSGSPLLVVHYAQFDSDVADLIHPEYRRGDVVA